MSFDAEFDCESKLYNMMALSINSKKNLLKKLFQKTFFFLVFEFFKIEKPTIRWDFISFFETRNHGAFDEKNIFLAKHTFMRFWST